MNDESTSQPEPQEASESTTAMRRAAKGIGEGRPLGDAWAKLMSGGANLGTAGRALGDLLPDSAWQDARQGLVDEIAGSRARLDEVISGLQANAMGGIRAADYAPVRYELPPLPRPATDESIRELGEELAAMSRLIRLMLDAAEAQVRLADMNHQTTRELVEVVKEGQDTADRVTKENLRLTRIAVGITTVGILWQLGPSVVPTLPAPIVSLLSPAGVMTTLGVMLGAWLMSRR